MLQLEAWLMTGNYVFVGIKPDSTHLSPQRIKGRFPKYELEIEYV